MKNDSVKKCNLYLAYGSNLFKPQMAVRCPSAQAIGLAKIKGFKLAFSRKTVRGMGALDILPCSGRVTYGGIYRITPEDLATLDKCEGLGLAYNRVLMAVNPVGYDRLVDVWVYRVIKPSLLDVPPSLDYATRVLLGLTEWNAPYWYRQQYRHWIYEISGHVI